MQVIEKIFEEETDEFNGYMLAYITNPSKENNLSNLLQEEKVDPKTIQSICKINDDILVIKNISVEEEFRGNGYGNEIVETLLSENLSGKALLFADILEEQINGFNLLKFYKSYGFSEAYKTRNDFLISEELKLALKKKPKLKR